MKHVMAKVKDIVRERASKKAQGKANENTKNKQQVSWDMSSDDALRAPIVSGYK